MRDVTFCSSACDPNSTNQILEIFGATVGRSVADKVERDERVRIRSDMGCGSGYEPVRQR